MSNTHTGRRPSKVLIIAAFAAVYVIWGSTYLAIDIAVNTIPPFLMLATRYTVAGFLLFIFCLLKGEKAPSLKAFITIGFGGVLMILLGNGAVTLAEQYLPTGLTAIIAATVPLWMVMLDKRNWHFYFSNKIIIAGFLIGFAGVLMLFAGKGTADFTGNPMKLAGFFILLVGSMGWAAGSLYSKYKQVAGSTTMKAAVQMLSAGLVSLAIGLLSNEQQGFAISYISAQSIEALSYLIIMGSLVGYMSYIWLLSILPASRVGTYAYVNPVIAVFLGWLFLDEAITMQQIAALLIILTGVILVNTAKEEVTTIVVKEITVKNESEVVER
ncbi:EamA family transporter [Ilyomonas limi]|uniref:EamA family transporter n=1 Tax=Ilyomonas limi TaxID=2575867 RepID=A0A4U3L6F4_9BACT|nr:EamA family transporter [Ilyomonas limi]TKK69296.1 EamA family transporter [Ilyomonas limi]